MIPLDNWSLTEWEGKKVYTREDYRIEQHFVRNPIVPELVWVAFLKHQRIILDSDLLNVKEYCDRRIDATEG